MGFVVFTKNKLQNETGGNGHVRFTKFKSDFWGFCGRHYSKTHYFLIFFFFLPESTFLLSVIWENSLQRPERHLQTPQFTLWRFILKGSVEQRSASWVWNRVLFSTWIHFFKKQKTEALKKLKIRKKPLFNTWHWLLKELSMSLVIDQVFSRYLDSTEQITSKFNIFAVGLGVRL